MELLFVLLIVLAGVAAAGFLYSRRKRLGATTQVGGNTGFAKVAQAQAKEDSAKGKVLALQAAAEVKKAAADVLKSAALEAHAGLDEAHAAFDEVHQILG